MESADVLAGIVAFRATARNRRNWNNFRGRNDCSVSAVLENNAVTTLIISVVCFEGRCVEAFIQCSIANPASHFLLARSGTNGLLLASALWIASITAPVVPPGLINIASGSFTANLEVAAVCDHDRGGRCNVTWWFRNFWYNNWGFRDHCFITNHFRLRDTLLLARLSAGTIISSHITLWWVISSAILDWPIDIVLDTASLPIEILLPIIVALRSCSVISNGYHSYSVNILNTLVGSGTLALALCEEPVSSGYDATCQ